MKMYMLLLLLSSQAINADECTNSRAILNNAIATCEQYKIDWAGRPVSGFIVGSWDPRYAWYACETTDKDFPGPALGYTSQTFRVSCGPTLPPPRDSQSGGCALPGSIVEVTNQVVGEKVSIVGAPFDLVYKSDRVIGRARDYEIDIPAFLDVISSSVSNMNIVVKNSLGTTVDNANFLPVVNTFHTHSWDGLDYVSIPKWGKDKKTVVVTETASDYTFGPIEKDVYLGNLKAIKLGVGAWLPSIWHYYDSESKTLFKGDGTYREDVLGVVSSGITRIADESGKLVYYFDSTGKIVETKTGITGTTIFSFAYDAGGRLLTITQPFSKVTTFTRNLSGVLQSITAPGGAITNVTINSYGYLTSITSPNSEVHTMTYHGTTGGLLATFEKPNGNVTTLTYDLKGNLTNNSHTSGYTLTLSKILGEVKATSSENINYSNKYNPSEKQETYTDPNGVTSYITRSEISNTSSSPIKYTSTRYRDDLRFGKQVKALRSKGLGDFGNRNSDFTHSVTLATPSDPFSITTMSIVEDISPSRMTSIYTGSTKTWNHTSKLGRTSSEQIDIYERPISIQRGTFTPTTLTYTNENLTKVSNGSSRETDYTYFANGLLKDVTNALGQVTSYTYDSDQRMASTTLPDLRVINYSYDSQGNLTSITPPSRPAHTFNFGTSEKVEEYLPPSLLSVPVVNTEYTYDLDKRLTSITRPDGESISFNYHTTTGNLTSLTGSFGTISNTYSQGLLTSTTNQYGVKINNTYLMSTVNGTTLSISSTPIYTYSRTPDSSVGQKVASETMNGTGSGSVSRYVAYSYDQDELLIGAGDMTLSYDTPNGSLISTTLDTIQDFYDYNSYGEVIQYIVKKGSPVIYQYDLVRDNLGRITQKTEFFNSVTTVYNYTYDSAGRLTQVKKNSIIESTYSYDGNSNRTGGSVRGTPTVATYDDQDRLTTYNGVARTYNPNGEVQTIGTATLDYDVFGSLLNYTDITNTVDYEIDAFNRRLGQTVNSVASSRVRYIYSPEGKVVGELDYQDKLVKRFVYATKGHVPDFYIDSAGNKFKIVTDHLGSVRMVVNSSSGVVGQYMLHDEFGLVLSDTSPGFTPFGYAGGLHSSESRLVRFGARDYDPETGRWLSKDPIRFNGGDTNLYGYVLQDPVNLVDPEGKAFILPILIIGIGILAPPSVPVVTIPIPPEDTDPKLSFPPGARIEYDLKCFRLLTGEMHCPNTRSCSK